MTRKMLLLAGSLALGSLAHADGVALGAHAGLMGPGVDGFFRLSDRLVLRGAYNAFDYDVDGEEEGVTYNGAYEFSNAQLGVDLYPFAGGFRMSAAYVFNGNEINLKALPTGGSFNLNDKDYSSNEVDNIRVGVDYPDSAAYVGIGWGNPVREGKGLGVTFDVGVYYVGEADVTQQVTCGTTPNCAQIKADAEVERQEIEDELADLPFWPLVQLGLSYQF